MFEQILVTVAVGLGVLVAFVGGLVWVGLGIIDSTLITTLIDNSNGSLMVEAIFGASGTLNDASQQHIEL